MKTYQDFLRYGNDIPGFIRMAIRDHETSTEFKLAKDAEEYFRHRNPSIMRAQKMVYNMLGKAVPDVYSANNKIPSNFFARFVTHEVQFLLGNGVTFKGEDTKDKLGGDDFDYAIQIATTRAINAGRSFVFYNNGRCEVFPLYGADEPSFVPIPDEETGVLKVGIRYWQLAPGKPLRATLYEEDGYTEYVENSEKQLVVKIEKRPYKQIIRRSALGTEVENGGNYNCLPIIPLYNISHQSELVGNRETIDAYDLMASALINNVDEGNLIYWVLKNCGGMTDADDAKFIEQLKITHVVHAQGDDGADVDAHAVEAPFEANEAALQRLEKQLYTDFMALNTESLASGAVTATQIKAAYEPLNSKADLLEYEVTKAIKQILKIAGIEDTPTYERSYLVNQNEEIQTLLSCADVLPQEYIAGKIITILGDIDHKDEILDAKVREEHDLTEPEESEEEETGEESGGDE